MYIKLYKKFRELWKDKPNKTTPVTAEAMMHIEQGIFDNSINSQELLWKMQELEARVEALEPVNIVSWADGTDEEIVAMVKALHSGRITVEDTSWQVGDERTMYLSGIESEYFGSLSSQTATLVILHRGGKLFEDGNECHFVVGMKEMFFSQNSMNLEATNAGGWDACGIRQPINNDFPKMLPESLLPIFSKFQNITAIGTGEETTISIDLFALAAEKEIIGTNKHANSTAESDLFQFDYYVSPANHRIKGGVGWWTRSSADSSPLGFCYIDNSGNSKTDNAMSSHGISLFGCI